MAMEHSELFERAQAFVRSDLSLDVLDDWIVEHLPSLLPPRDNAASRLAGSIQLWIAEMNRGHRSAEEIRVLVADYLRSNVPIVLSSIRLHASSGNASLLAFMPMAPEGQVQIRGDVQVQRVA